MPAGPVVELFLCADGARDYLAFMRLREVAMRTAASIGVRPLLREDLPPPSAAPGETDARARAEAAYLAKDLLDWARFCGVPLAPVAGRRVDAGWAVRALVIAAGTGRDAALLRRLFEAAFTEGRDVWGREGVLALARDTGLDAADLAARLDSPSVRAALRANSAALLARGGYDSPTMFFGDDMYVGHERSALLEAALNRASDRRFVLPGDHRA